MTIGTFYEVFISEICYIVPMARKKTSDIILNIIAKSADKAVDLGLCFLDPYGMQKGEYEKGTKLSDIVSDKAIKSAADRLKKKGCLEKVNKKGKIYYKITEKGRNIVEKYIFDRKKWDGDWRIVIFDIPEERRKLRSLLRNQLRQSGFKHLQKSVWVSPFDVFEDIEEMVRVHNLHNELWFFKSKSLMNDEEIIEMFIDN